MANTETKEDLKDQEEKKEVTSEEATSEKAEDGAAPAGQTGFDEAELSKLKDEVASGKDKYVRLYSEFENFRRRTAREKLEMIQTANEQLIIDLLPVADDFERAEKSLREKKDQDAEGFSLIHNKFKKVLESYGVKAIDVKSGSEFNTDFHEAITQIPAPKEDLRGKIIEVTEKGYLLNDKVIRYAKVVVGS